MSIRMDRNGKNVTKWLVQTLELINNYKKIKN